MRRLSLCVCVAAVVYTASAAQAVEPKPSRARATLPDHDGNALDDDVALLTLVDPLVAARNGVPGWRCNRPPIRQSTTTRETLMRTLLLIAMLTLPTIAFAHGEGGDGGEIDQHHANLRDALQAELGEAYDTPVGGLDSADMVNGEAVYRMHCESCHGASGEGDGPAAGGLSVAPAPLTDGVQMNFISDAGYLQVLRTGLIETGMPAYGEVLAEDEMINVYAYTKTMRRTPAADEHHCAAVPGAWNTAGAMWALLGLVIPFLRRRRQ